MLLSHCIILLLNTLLVTVYHQRQIKDYISNFVTFSLQGQCKSSVLLIESDTEIVQLNHAHRSLLVSTKQRCLVYRMDEQDRIIQIGSKDRKMLVSLVACFHYFIKVLFLMSVSILKIGENKT